jgi:hypothetical protein
MKSMRPPSGLGIQEAYNTMARLLLGDSQVSRRNPVGHNVAATRYRCRHLLQIPNNHIN